MEDEHLKNRAPQRQNAGISRILESVIAAFIIIIVFMAATFLINSSNFQAQQEKGDLERMGYNTLANLVESRTIEATIEKNPQEAVSNLRAFLQRTLPNSIYFKLVVSQREGEWAPFDIIIASTSNNFNEDIFTNSLYTSSTPVIYTSESGEIYSIILTLSRG